MKEDYILSKETYKLRGIFFDVHNKLGSIQKEKAYSNALEIIFKRLSIPYIREKKISLDFEGKRIGTLYSDFIIWDKIVIEVKAKKFFVREDFRQTLRYLKALDLPLALLVNFKSDKVKVRRIINTC